MHSKMARKTTARSSQCPYRLYIPLAVASARARARFKETGVAWRSIWAAIDCFAIGPAFGCASATLPKESTHHGQRLGECGAGRNIQLS
jgi:hypothetical protein